MGFLSDLATLLNAGMTVADIKDLAKINSSAQITPETPEKAPEPLPDDQKDKSPSDQKKAPEGQKNDSQTQTEAETAILTEISKLTSAIQAANILNSAKTGMPKQETTDDILAGTIRQMGGAPIDPEQQKR